MNNEQRRVNDVGGLDLGPVDTREYGNTLFEQRADSMIMLLIHPKVGAFKVDALRRAIEQNSPEDYRDLPYYTKWIRAVRILLLEQEIVTPEELDAKLETVRERHRNQEAGHG